MEASPPPVSPFHLHYHTDMKTMREYHVSRQQNEHINNPSRSTSTPPRWCGLDWDPWRDMNDVDIDMEQRDAVVAACHLLLLSNSLQINRRQQPDGGWEYSPAHEAENDVGAFGIRARRCAEDSSDSFFMITHDARASLTGTSASASLISAPSSNINDFRSYYTSGGGSHNDTGNESSSAMVGSDISTEVTSNNVNVDSIAHIRKRKKMNNTSGRSLADIVGQERESEVLDRPAHKHRYRSLSDLLRRLH